MAQKKREKKAAEVLADPAAAKRTRDERAKYFAMSQVQRAISIERAEKKPPIVDVPRQGKRKPN